MNQCGSLTRDGAEMTDRPATKKPRRSLLPDLEAQRCSNKEAVTAVRGGYKEMKGARPSGARKCEEAGEIGRRSETSVADGKVWGGRCWKVLVV